MNRPIAVQFSGGALVVGVMEKFPHPDADRLDIIEVSESQIYLPLVVGQHYEKGQLGIYIRPGVLIPGWLAEDLWMVKKGDSWTAVEPRVMRGVRSAGIFVGQRWRNTPTSEWQAWPLWRRRWKVGDDVTAYLGLVELR